MNYSYGEESIEMILVIAEAMTYSEEKTFSKKSALKFGDRLVKVAQNYIGSLVLLENIAALFKYAGDEKSKEAKRLANNLK